MHRTRRLFALLLAVLSFVGVVGASLPAFAQQAGAARGEALQTPARFLGYELGERFTPHHRVVDYVRHVAAASPRAQVEPYGTSYEGRPLLLLTLSAPETLAQLEDVRRTHLQRAGLAPGGTGNGRADDAIVWLSYNVHGDEAVSTEAAMKTLYDLADPQNARTGRWLANGVVLLDPCLNPDGRDRYVQWYRQTRGAQPNARPAAREHAQPWPGGRTNHYLFDLNRDWAWATQQETRARLAQYHRWMPHVHVDFHEQGVDAPYYFAPGAEPMHEALTPFQRSFQERMGRANADVFDREGWLYFTREVFDLLYPGYGDTWPLFNGAIGMTYEQAGGGRAGLLIQNRTDSLSLAERIAHHHATGLTTVETAVENRAALTEAFADYYRTAEDEPLGAYAAYVVSGANEDRRDALAALLDQQRIEYRYAAGDADLRGTGYATGRRERFSVRAGDLVVPAVQPKARLVNVLFERRPALSDSLTYDITAWGLPYAFGVDAYATSAMPDVAMRGTARRDRRAAATSDAAAPYAYLAEWKSLADARLLGQLLQRGVRVRCAREPFEAAGRQWARGTLVIARADNRRDRFARRVEMAAREAGQPVTPLQSGFTAGGPDFGSSSVAALESPAVAVMTGAGLSPYAVGEVWHFFDQRLGYPATMLAASDFDAVLLEDFDVLVLPSGDYGDALGEDAQTALRTWVEGGGRLIAMERAAGFLADVDGFDLERRASGSGDADAPGDLDRRYDERERAAASRRVPGAIFRARLDPTHPLAYGYGADEAPSYYYTLKRGTAAFEPFDGNGWNVAVLPADDDGAPVSGFAGVQAQQQLAGTLVFGVEDVGRGQVVYLVDDPLFRGFWQGGMLLFSNAVFMTGAR